MWLRQVLVITLQRFQLEHSPAGTVVTRKNESPVTFDETLDLAEAGVDRQDLLTDMSTKDELFGVVQHHSAGQDSSARASASATATASATLECGHYTAGVKHDGYWLLCDNSNLAAPTDFQALVTNKAYLLFYRRIDHA